MTVTTQARAVCPSCKTELVGAWCHTCGERRRDTHDISVRAFAAEVWQTLTDTDSRLWRTTRALVAQPGVLTRDWAEGRRRIRVPPLRLFLIANVVYFLSQSLTGFNAYTTPLSVHLNRSIHEDIARGMVRSRMAEGEEDYRVFETRFDDTAKTQAKSLIIVFAPFLALLVAGLERRRRLPFAVHLVFALHFLAFLMLAGAVLDPVLVLVERSRLVPQGWVSWANGAVYATLWSTYLFFAFRTAYSRTHAGAAVAAFASVAAFVVLLLGYRIMLFFTVFYTV